MKKKERSISYTFSLTIKIFEKIENMAKINDLNSSELMQIVINYLDKNPEELEKILEAFELE